jgi:ASC-1-like (ASCH) protein
MLFETKIRHMTGKKTMHINKRRTITICSGFIITTVVLMAAVIGLATEDVDKRETIEKLNAQVSQLEKNLSYYKTLNEEKLEEKNFQQFVNKTFQLRFPNFAETVRIVYKKSNEYGFNPYLVMAMIQVESGFNPNAVSNEGACGLMQVNYSVWKDQLNINYERIFDKEYNIELGLKVLKHYYDKAEGNIFVALSRYCSGYNPNCPVYNSKIMTSRFYTHRFPKENIPAEQDDASI